MQPGNGLVSWVTMKGGCDYEWLNTKSRCLRRWFEVSNHKIAEICRPLIIRKESKHKCGGIGAAPYFSSPARPVYCRSLSKCRKIKHRLWTVTFSACPAHTRRFPARGDPVCMGSVSCAPSVIDRGNSRSSSIVWFRHCRYFKLFQTWLS